VFSTRRRVWWLVIVGALAATPVYATTTITDPFLGIRLYHETHTAAEGPWFRPLNIFVAEIDLAAPGLSFQMSPRAPSPPYPGPEINGQFAESIRQTTRQYANSVGAQLAINGAFYAAIDDANGVHWANNVGLTASSATNIAGQQCVYCYSSWDTMSNIVQWYENYFHDAVNISATNQVTFVKMPENIGDGYAVTPSTTALYNAVTGQYRLLQNGNVRTEFAGGPLNPVTAVGVTAANKLLLFAVDGRQGLSGGMTLTEVANLLKNTYGATHAINLDGGGSTTMVANYFNDGQSAIVLNSPSDGSERSVASSLAVFALPNGDYNQNGIVDAADYVRWRNSISGQTAYDAWRSHFGQLTSAAGQSSTVAEPAAYLLATLAAGCFGLWSRISVRRVMSQNESIATRRCIEMCHDYTDR